MVSTLKWLFVTTLALGLLLAVRESIPSFFAKDAGVVFILLVAVEISLLVRLHDQLPRFKK
jgi:hypothetical protein